MSKNSKLFFINMPIVINLNNNEFANWNQFKDLLKFMADTYYSVLYTLYSILCSVYYVCNLYIGYYQ